MQPRWEEFVATTTFCSGTVNWNYNHQISLNSCSFVKFMSLGPGLGPANYATETNIKWKQVNNEKPYVHVSPLALYVTSKKTSLPSLKTKNKINHKKRSRREGNYLWKVQRVTIWDSCHSNSLPVAVQYLPYGCSLYDPFACLDIGALPPAPELDHELSPQSSWATKTEKRNTGTKHQFT